jgi:hypothetical protein
MQRMNFPGKSTNANRDWPPFQQSGEVGIHSDRKSRQLDRDEIQRNEWELRTIREARAAMTEWAKSSLGAASRSPVSIPRFFEWVGLVAPDDLQEPTIQGNHIINPRLQVQSAL